MGASSQDSEVCSNPDLLRRPHSDSSASLSNSSCGDSDISDSATQSGGGGHQHSSSSRKASVVRARKVSSERIKRAPSSSWKVNWTEEMVCTIYILSMCVCILCCDYVYYISIFTVYQYPL